MEGITWSEDEENITTMEIVDGFVLYTNAFKKVYLSSGELFSEFCHWCHINNEDKITIITATQGG